MTNGHVDTWQGRFTLTRELIDNLKVNPVENNKKRIMASVEELATALNEVLNFIDQVKNQAKPS